MIDLAGWVGRWPPQGLEHDGIRTAPQGPVRMLFCF